MKRLGYAFPLKLYYGTIFLNSQLKYATFLKCLYYSVQNKNKRYLHLKFL